MLIPFDKLFSKYKIHCTGILHIGASTGQEMPAYRSMTEAPVIFIEAIREVYAELKKKMAHYTNVTCLNACISDIDGDQVTFNISNNEMQSSSLLEFGTHSHEHPGVVFTHKRGMQTTTVRTLLQGEGINSVPYNFLNIDLQGAEMMALRGMDLSSIKYAYIEVNTAELYQGCPQLAEIDAFLLGHGLQRVEIAMTPHHWGDAFYVRNDQKPYNIVQVPAEFQPRHPSQYPEDNETDFERYYFEQFTGTDQQTRTYLPVMWTAYYCRHKYGKDHSKLEQLQNFLNQLDRQKKYYTIVQYDDGILNKTDHLDLKVYSMSGKPMDYALPLICQPHAPQIPEDRTVWANFVGRVTHPIRQLLGQYKGRSGWLIVDKQMSLSRFCQVLNRSVFTLCPRGYGPTSFRIQEAMQYGSIPVYISDEFIHPHGIRFEHYGICVRPEHVNNLPEILAEVDVPDMQARVAKYYQSFFTYQSNKFLIDEDNRALQGPA